MWMAWHGYKIWERRKKDANGLVWSWHKKEQLCDVKISKRSFFIILLLFWSRLVAGSFRRRFQPLRRCLHRCWLKWLLFKSIHGKTASPSADWERAWVWVSELNMVWPHNNNNTICARGYAEWYLSDLFIFIKGWPRTKNHREIYKPARFGFVLQPHARWRRKKNHVL